MNTRTRKQRARSERYDVERSPLAQGLTQKELARLVGLKKSALKGILINKHDYTVRRQQDINGKSRLLVYPRGKFRTIHEKLKHILKRIRLPSYVYSPRVGRSQRDNALVHSGQNQFLKFDIKQFYPSTTSSHVRKWALGIGMQRDVANLFTDLATIDGYVSFGSPATPVLVSHVHRAMFDEIYELCRRRGLRMSLWVDDVVISGQFVPGSLLLEVRNIIMRNGLKSHKFEYKTGSRRVQITGISVIGHRLDAPLSLHRRIKSAYNDVLKTHEPSLYQLSADKLLSYLGTFRYVVGRESGMGQRTADRMNALRQKRRRIEHVATTLADSASVNPNLPPDDLTAPF